MPQTRKKSRVARGGIREFGKKLRGLTKSTLNNTTMGVAKDGGKGTPRERVGGTGALLWGIWRIKSRQSHKKFGKT